MIKPLLDRVLLQRIQKNSSLQLPNIDEHICKAKVIEVGEDVKSIKKDEIVYYENFSSIKLDTYELIKEIDIIGKEI